MADVIVQQFDHVRFYLKSEIAPRIKIKEPVGWREDGIEFARHDKYHGIMTQFTGELTFYKEAKDYIEEDYLALGVNSNLQLIKHELRRVGDEIKWQETYLGYVDYTTRKISDKQLKIKFNANRLEEILKTREDDEFDFDRTTSVEDKAITSFDNYQREVYLDGISLVENVKLVLNLEDFEYGDEDYTSNLGWVRSNNETNQDFYITGYLHDNINDFLIVAPVLNLVTSTTSRISSPDSTLFDDDYASKMFFVDQIGQDESLSSLKAAYAFQATISLLPEAAVISGGRVWIGFYILRRQPTVGYELVRRVDIESYNVDATNPIVEVDISGQQEFNDLAWNEGVVFGLFMEDNGRFPLQIFGRGLYVSATKCDITISLDSTSPRTTGHSFILVHDAFTRLTEILTGYTDRFVSREFGMPEVRLSDVRDQTSGDNVGGVVNANRAIDYTRIGDYGEVGLINGFSIRNWPKENIAYKPIRLSFADLYESVDAVFNVGLGIELIDGKQRIVVEDKKYFYQDRVVIKLDKQILNVERATLKKRFISSIEIGYDKGGDYSDSLGADEPNVRTNRITPIIKNKQEYRKISKIRADDVGMEQTRRKPFSLFPDDDLGEDEHIWFLDLIINRPLSITNIVWTQKRWFERLRVPPENLSYAESFRSFLFTPLRMIFRHGWIIREGLNQQVNMNKKISHINSDSNSSLITHFLEDLKPYSEEGDVLIGELERPVTEPESVKFTYPIDDNLLDLFNGKTKVKYRGEDIILPNYYFKIEYVNENGEREYGYIKSLKPKINQIELIKSNEKILVNAL